MLTLRHGRRTAWVVGAAGLTALAAFVASRAPMNRSAPTSTVSFAAVGGLGAQGLTPEVVDSLETIRGGLVDLVEAITALEAELERARSEQRAVHAHVQHLEHSLRTAESDGRHLREDLMSMRGRNVALAAQLVETLTKHDQTEAELGELRSANEALAHELDGMKLLNQSVIELGPTAILAVEARIQEIVAEFDKQNATLAAATE